MKTTLSMLAGLTFGMVAPAVCSISAAEKPASGEVQSVSFTKGVLMAVIDGTSVAATNEVSLPRNIVVETTGTFTVAGGKKRALTEGQVLSRDGRLTSPDGSVVPVDDHVTSHGGKILLIQNGEPQLLTTMTQLADGTRVYPDGRMVSPRNATRRLLDGQIVRLNAGGVEATDTARIEKGKVVLFKDGGRIELRAGQVMAMSDGSRINGSGAIVKPDGSQLALKEGELHRFSGAGNTR
ncbi:MAG: hypothetical protein JNN07_07460 [Verrucomicrobiales bacterium]|nr:hypothetical protein [Verrucomicrobiales bacterium]